MIWRYFLSLGPTFFIGTKRFLLEISFIFLRIGLTELFYRHDHTIPIKLIIRSFQSLGKLSDLSLRDSHFHQTIDNIRFYFGSMSNTLSFGWGVFLLISFYGIYVGVWIFRMLFTSLISRLFFIIWLLRFALDQFFCFYFFHWFYLLYFWLLGKFSNFTRIILSSLAHLLLALVSIHHHLIRNPFRFLNQLNF